MQLVEKCSPFARVVVTGSGLVTLLNSFRTARVNGFALWDAVTYVGLGSAPSLPTSETMAARLLDAYAVVWPSSVRDAVTPKVLVDSLARGELTSARPALLAYMLGRMGDASTGTATDVLDAALGAAISKLKAESVRDTLSALTSMNDEERRALRDVAVGEYTCDELAAIRKGWGMGMVSFKNACHVGVQPGKLAALIGCLREKGSGSEVVRLQPPYAALLQSWVRPSGALAVRVDNDRIDLDFATRSNLVLICEERKEVEVAGLWRVASKAFLASLASNGVGFRDKTRRKIVRAPASAKEFGKVPALARLNDLLNIKFLEAVDVMKREKGKKKCVKRPSTPSLYRLIHGAVQAEGAAEGGSSRFQEKLGMELILAFRHFHSHIWGDATCLVRNGLTAAVVTEAVDAVVEVLAATDRGCFIRDSAVPELMTRKRAPENRHEVR